jgi:hypothetical protein
MEETLKVSEAVTFKPKRFICFTTNRLANMVNRETKVKRGSLPHFEANKVMRRRVNS